MKNDKPYTGSYRTLLACRKAEVIYDLTSYFCGKYFHRGDRTIDQMVQAARSGKQNIIEGVESAKTSSETLLKLINVANSSLHELLADYEDYLRIRNMQLWEKDSKEAVAMRKLGRKYKNSKPFIEIAQTRSDEVVANMVIVLIYQALLLLHRYYAKQYRNFIENGGFRENLTKERIAYRNKKK